MPIISPTPQPFLHGRRLLADARALAEEFGEQAGDAAELRAAQSRMNDNALAYCHWREVGRMVAWLAGEGERATVQ